MTLGSERDDKETGKGGGRRGNYWGVGDKRLSDGRDENIFLVFE